MRGGPRGVVHFLPVFPFFLPARLCLAAGLGERQPQNGVSSQMTSPAQTPRSQPPAGQRSALCPWERNPNMQQRVGSLDGLQTATISRFSIKRIFSCRWNRIIRKKLSSGLCSLIKKFHLNFLYLSNSIRLKAWKFGAKLFSLWRLRSPWRQRRLQREAVWCELWAFSTNEEGDLEHNFQRSIQISTNEVHLCRLLLFSPYLLWSIYLQTRFLCFNKSGVF